jgi:DNA (cytosine-5)-methyltransferase 3A
MIDTIKIKEHKRSMNENHGITVLSLCDGMSCGRIALTELGVKVNRYYASEIDKHCIKQTQLNFPDTIQLGDIEGWREWDIDWASINLVLAGTPCTGFSFCGKMLNFDDPQSRLFWVFTDILNHIKTFNPGVLFLFENVRMEKWCLGTISEALGVQPVFINSALVSAQERKRYYWSNIRIKEIGLFRERYTDIPQPRDRGIVLKDILEQDVDEKYFISEDRLKAINSRAKTYRPKISSVKAGCLTVSYGTHGGNDASSTYISVEGKARTQRASTGRSLDAKHNYQIIQLNPSRASGGVQPYQQDRVYDVSGKSPALMAELSCGTHSIYTKSNIRRLTPTECARLQTIPDWYRWECSDTQIYIMCGNGWTIEVIKHILSYMKI